MDTQNTPTPANAPNPDTDTSSPNYGEFGGVKPAPHSKSQAGQPTNPTPPGRSGANDNPDEFSEFKDKEKEAQKAPDNPEDQPGHIEQNQDPAAVRAARNADTDEQRDAWAKDDPRYAGGGTHNTREEPAGNPATDE